jgi:hypothetical protein
MYHAVASLVAVVYLTGMALGLRFRVIVLFPAGIAVLISSAVVRLTWPSMAGWGLIGTLALLIVLNVGFAFGLLLRVGAAFLSLRKAGRLFVRPVHVDPAAHPPGNTAGEGTDRAGVIKAAAAIARHDLIGKGLHR